MTTRWKLSDMPTQAGKRFFITGANSGIGYYAALELAKRGGIVVMACRDQARGQAALERLKREATGPESAASEAELVVLDLASLASVRAAATAECTRNLPLHCLINNAGVMAPKQRLETRDGYELQFGTNVLGHFALTCLLMPLLERGRASRPEDASRVVTLASIAHKSGKINFDDLESERSYSPMGAYQQSKLADLMFSFELERCLREKNLGVVSLAAHPGVANTNLFHAGEVSAAEKLGRKFMGTLFDLFLNSEQGGALPTLYAATADSAEPGAYYGPQGFMEMRGGDVGPAKIAPQALDQKAQKRLWEICVEETDTKLA
ncbi:oxidoreductase [Granulicella tundricola]|uniref:Short-chain dehydrogenase/reductase SDR n=1 Tax=Granulicella tundricola (strain ATCC BAA-1859 / DSM 23138 / MP5ACTX9) TaxID=1198114 RepID=E8X3G3_GRATM|nr:oxidoreductase [Granulicella tundricola]ADW70464.1 short-chain dehydrogenase/reductase SDR [Granulicella tundricola MP5ACTX9]